MKSKIPEFFFLVFTILWITILSTDYINKHPYYLVSYTYFRFINLGIFIVGLGILLLFMDRIGKVQRYLFTGLGVFFLFSIFILASGLSFSKYAGIPDFGIEQLSTFFTKSIFSALCLISILTSALFWGKLLNKSVLKSPIVNIGVGIILIAFVIFILGLFNFSNQISLSIVLIIPFLFSWKNLKTQLINLTVSYIRPKTLSPLGLISGYIMLFFLTINFCYIQSPFPIGFDSRNLYMNIARQVSLNEGLIFGFRPYNWALVISMGYSVFKSTAVALSISFVGYILSLAAIFQFGTKTLKVNANYLLFSLLILTVSPAITNQLYVELKTDFGLLFFQSLTLYVLFDFINSNVFQEFKSQKFSFSNFKNLLGHLVLLGLFIGFGLGIKLTNMFLLFSVVISMGWFISEQKTIIVSFILLTMSLFLLAKLDDLSGLRLYHEGLDKVLILFILIGIISLVLAFVKHKSDALKSIVFSLILGIFSIIPLTPWLIKNYSETKSLNPSALLNGASPGPVTKIGVLNENYLRSLE